MCRLIAMDKKRFIGSHSDVTSIGPHIVIQPCVEVTLSVMYDVVVFVMCAMY